VQLTDQTAEAGEVELVELFRTHPVTNLSSVSLRPGRTPGCMPGGLRG
jgi:hypothetical protein